MFGGRGLRQVPAPSGRLAFLLAVPVGLAYGWLLNRTRGQEMMVGTYLGFAVVSGMSIFWTMAPFTNPQLVWAIGGRQLFTYVAPAVRYSKLDNDFRNIPPTPAPSFASRWTWPCVSMK